VSTTTVPRCAVRRQLRVDRHLRRLKGRVRDDAAGATDRRIPLGHLTRDTAAGRQRIARALVRVELSHGGLAAPSSTAPAPELPSMIGTSA
jgi:hypothetical protein